MGSRQNRKSKLYLLFNGECLYCCRALNFSESTIEHLIPLSCGGSSKLNNLALSCSPCNNMRGSQDIHFFVEQHPNRDVILSKLHYISIMHAHRSNQRQFADLKNALRRKRKRDAHQHSPINQIKFWVKMGYLSWKNADA